ncbi:hypothetical protein [Paenibacillus typhae]|uniref:Uncharacterized protein n=1 Tax=Paenibacillus typhae TaxID=1174501 RepID=A0A1G8TCP3_9BACL|nr:hypothetical protein [Paenibacillus typhae]SDJ38685.1 hypothetical protein SAMN05216192_11661 [Paenibacillus typhae]
MFKLFSKTDLKLSFWKWFSKREYEFYTGFEDNKEEYMAEISRRLHELDENLTYEIGTVNADGQREFIISADGIADSFETVEMLCGKAPVYSNWIIIPFRPRMNSDSIQIDMGDVSLSYEDIYFSYESNGQVLDLNVYIRNYDQNDGCYQFAYFILLDSLIGEYDAVSKIGNTRFELLTAIHKSRALPFVKLRGIVDGLIV